MLSEVLSSWYSWKNSSYSGNSFLVHFSWRLILLAESSVRSPAQPWCEWMQALAPIPDTQDWLFPGREAAQTLQASSCLWKAPAKLAKAAFMLLLQLQTALLSGLCACMQLCKLHPFLLFCANPGVLTANISSPKRDAFSGSVHVVVLGAVSEGLMWDRRQK